MFLLREAERNRQFSAKTDGGGGAPKEGDIFSRNGSRGIPEAGRTVQPSPTPTPRRLPKRTLRLGVFTIRHQAKEATKLRNLLLKALGTITLPTISKHLIRFFLRTLPLRISSREEVFSCASQSNLPHPRDFASYLIWGKKHDSAAGSAAPAKRWNFATVGNVTVIGTSRVSWKSRKFAEFPFPRGCGSDQRGP